MRKLLFLLIVSASTFVHAEDTSSNPFCTRSFLNPVQQWLAWEQRDNHWRFVQPLEAARVRAIGVDRSQTVIQQSDLANPDLLSMFGLSTNQVIWPQHPLARDREIPFVSNTNYVQNFNWYYTASRSMVFSLGPSDLYSIKMPTERPHTHILSKPQPKKATLRNDLLIAMPRSQHVERVEAQLGTDPRLILARDVLAVTDNETRTGGFIVRDISFMKDGRRYFPASAIPFAGRRIAEAHGMTPADFWRLHYAIPTGVAKAIFLLRYGLQMESPSPQNTVIPMNENLMPDGTVVFRDLPDSYFIQGVSETLGFREAMDESASLEYPAIPLSLEWNSWSIFRLSRERYRQSAIFTDRFLNEWWLLFDDETLASWGRAHAEAYVGEIERALNLRIDFPGRGQTSGSVDWSAMEQAVAAALNSPQGRMALERYQAELRATRI